MKKGLLIFILIWINAVQLNAQAKKGWGFEAGLINNHQHFMELYDGILELGVGYDFFVHRNLSAGAMINTGWLRRTNTNSAATTFRPKLNLRYSIQLSSKIDLIPEASMGYSMLSFRNSEFDYNEIQSGINTSAGLRMLWDYNQKTSLFVFGRIDYIYLSKDNDFTRLEYFRDVYLTTFGIGLKINRTDETNQ